MALSVDEVRKIARLARLDLTAEEEEKFTAQLGQIVDYIDQLKRFPSAEPLTVTGVGEEADDAARPSDLQEAMLRNAPAALDHFFLVPQVKSTGDG